MSIFKTPKPPKVRMPTPPPPTPERSDPETQALAAAQRTRYSSTGRAMSMLTGGSGVEDVMTASRYLGSATRT